VVELRTNTKKSASAKIKSENRAHYLNSIDSDGIIHSRTPAMSIIQTF